MAESQREATVRLRLENGDYLVNLRKVGDENKKTADNAKRDASRWGDAYRRVGEDLKGLAGHVTQIAGTLLSLGGAISLGGAVQQTVALQGSYKDLAFAIEQSTGEAMDWRAVQADIEDVADKWARSNEEIGASFADLFKTSEDLEFSKQALEAITVTANTTGASIDALTNLTNELGEKFGISGDRMGEALSMLSSQIPGGKDGLEELAGSFGLIAAQARASGMAGEDGLNTIVTLLNRSGAAGKNFKDELKATAQLIETLADVDKVKAIEKELKVKITESDGTTRRDALKSIIQAVEGSRSSLSKVFSGSALRLAGELGDVYSKVFAETAGSASEKTAAAAEALERAMSASSKKTMTFAENMERAQQRVENDPQRQLQLTINEMTRAFAQPELIEGLTELAKVAPGLAKELGDLLKFAAQNPLLAAAGAGGAFALQSAFRGAASGAAEAFVSKAFAGGVMQSAGGSFAAAAFAPALLVAAGAALGAAAITLYDEHVQKADKQRREKRANELQARLTDEFNKTGKQRKLTEEERLILAEGTGQALESITDLGQVRAKFQRDQQRRAEVQSMGVDFGGGEEVNGVPIVRLKGDQAERFKQGINTPGSMVPNWVEQEGLAGAPVAPAGPKVARKGGGGASGTFKVEADGASFADALRTRVLRVEVVNPTALNASRGNPQLPAPAPGVPR